jgi:hypothetical protein
LVFTAATTRVNSRLLLQHLGAGHSQRGNGLLCVGSDVQIVGEGGVFLNEAEAGVGLGSHQVVDRFAG